MLCVTYCMHILIFYILRRLSVAVTLCMIAWLVCAFCIDVVSLCWCVMTEADVHSSYMLPELLHLQLCICIHLLLITYLQVGARTPCHRPCHPSLWCDSSFFVNGGVVGRQGLLFAFTGKLLLHFSHHALLRLLLLLLHSRTRQATSGWQ